ncbi:hypothetical protein HMPREF9946_03113 [Acetobacteraceae bacterium AT-5844]|nr:hypothetical protein HMPREF9946_03113 [Acetobacteraceae bacterium AT-5844]
MSDVITKAQMYAKLLDRIAKHGEQVKLAHEAGVSPAFINRVVNSHAEISPALAEALGYRRVTMFAPIKARSP